jgi:excisionase family DNA binding protein
MKQSTEPSVEPSTVSLSEASRLLSKPENTIREWIKTSKLQAHRDSRGRWLIRRHDLMAFIAVKGSTEGRPGATSNPTSKARSNVEGSTEPTVEPSTTRYIRSLEDSLDRERRINDELRQQLRHVEQERTQHIAEMRAMLSKDGSGGKEGVLSRWIRR